MIFLKRGIIFSIPVSLTSLSCVEAIFALNCCAVSAEILPCNPLYRSHAYGTLCPRFVLAIIPILLVQLETTLVRPLYADRIIKHQFRTIFKSLAVIKSHGEHGIRTQANIVRIAHYLHNSRPHTMQTISTILGHTRNYHANMIAQLQAQIFVHQRPRTQGPRSDRLQAVDNSTHYSSIKCPPPRSQSAIFLIHDKVELCHDKRNMKQAKKKKKKIVSRQKTSLAKLESLHAAPQSV